MRRIVLVALTGVLVVAGGLVADMGRATAGGGAIVDTKSVRTQIAGLVKQSYPDLLVGNVMCPPGVARAAGNSFACTVQVPGTFLVVGADQLDRGRLQLTAQHAVIARRDLEQFVASNATLSATVTCGTAVFVVVRPGQKLTCAAAIADGSNRQVEVLVRDVAGNVAITNVS